MLSAQTILSFFAILAISSLTVFIARKVKIPHTVFLVIVGILLGILSFIDIFAFVKHFELTPALLFYLLLPTLIFESAYAMNSRKMAENITIISLLSVVSLLLSAFAIAIILGFGFSLIGITLPFIFLLLFGALISATDPVAVLALFKEYGAPERLSLIFEGESLFNDATSVAFFLIVLEVITHGFHGAETVLVGTGQFLFMMAGGILFGTFMGLLFAGLVGKMRESEVGSITLTIALAHLTFILSEVISKQIHFSGHEFPISSIIATTIASLIMGNYGRAKLHPNAEPFVARLWSQLAFMANSVIFVLIGLLVVRSGVWSKDLILPILITVLVVAFSRALSIYPITWLYNVFAPTHSHVPQSWSHLLSWGSLRGALAVTMVLLVPKDLTLPFWPLSLTPQEFLLALTVGCICATLFVKATTIRSFMKKLGLDKRSDLEEIEYHQAHTFIHDAVGDKIEYYLERGYITDTARSAIKQSHTDADQRSRTTMETLVKEDTTQVTDRILRIFAIGIEHTYLKELYRFGEVNEAVYRKLAAKLTLQLEALEEGEIEPQSTLHTDGLDIFERLYYRIKGLFVTTPEATTIQNLYLYYRAQSIIARKVLKELEALGDARAAKIFSAAPLKRLIELYEKYKNQSGTKADELALQHQNTIKPLHDELAWKGAHKVAATTLLNLEEKLLVTKNLAITLRDELELMRDSRS